MLVAEHGYIVAREVVDEFGDIQDWRNVTGNGPLSAHRRVGGQLLDLHQDR